MRLGIDFGTTRTVVAAVDAGRYPLAAFDRGEGFVDHVPGVAALDGAGTLRTGWDAAPLLSEPRGPVLRSIKRVVSSLAPDDEVPGFHRTALELCTDFLAELRRAIVDSSNIDVREGEPLEAMIAVPANASSRQRYLTLESFRRAGFEVLGMVNEPTAAAIDYAHKNLRDVGPSSPKRYVVVYDLGGGTFDTAAVSLRDNRFELLATDGIARLGGDDFDELVLELALESMGGRERDLSPSTRVRLLESCREIKERLTPNSKRLLVDLTPAIPDAEVAVEVSELYERARPLIDSTLAPMERVFARLRERGVDPDDPRQLGAVYLVGGAVGFPAVGRALRDVYKRKLKLAQSPHAATAIGLAIAADPDAGVFVREAVTRWFGVWREAEHGREKVFDAILEKNALPADGEPIVVTRQYSPAHAVGHLRFLECSRLEDGEPAGDLTPWRELLVDYVPDASGDRAELSRVRLPHVAGDEVVETYVYDHEGRVSVEIANRTRGTRATYELGALS